MEIFKQPQYDPIPVEVQVAVLWAVQRGYLDNVPVDRVKEFQLSLTEYLTTREPVLLKRITTQGNLDDALNAELKSVMDRFKETWK
jgi:F-type H+-transporting ATPase subunit alpha